MWSYVTFNRRPHVTFGDGHWYVICEDECAWEPEHGLQTVFTDGQAPTRISSYDGHPTHQSAYGRGYDVPEGAVYWSQPAIPPVEPGASASECPSRDHRTTRPEPETSPVSPGLEARR
ncbi:DUF6985 domain-containing protein [Gordonia sp. NPDC003504]